MESYTINANAGTSAFITSSASFRLPSAPFVSALDMSKANAVAICALGTASARPLGLSSIVGVVDPFDVDPFEVVPLESGLAEIAANGGGVRVGSAFATAGGSGDLLFDLVLAFDIGGANDGLVPAEGVLDIDSLPDRDGVRSVGWAGRGAGLRSGASSSELESSSIASGTGFFAGAGAGGLVAGFRAGAGFVAGSGAALAGMAAEATGTGSVFFAGVGCPTDGEGTATGVGWLTLTIGLGGGRASAASSSSSLLARLPVSRRYCCAVHMKSNEQVRENDTHRWHGCLESL
jgi:hypothetical protein